MILILLDITKVGKCELKPHEIVKGSHLNLISKTIFMFCQLFLKGLND